MSDGIRVLMEQAKDGTLLDELKKAGSADEVKTILDGRGIVLTEEDFTIIRKRADGEMTEDELMAVAGGMDPLDPAVTTDWGEFWRTIINWFDW